jgi:hypothetical protein
VSLLVRQALIFRSYSLDKGQSFAEGLQSSTLDMAADEGRAQGAQKASQLRWDRKKKRFTAGDQVGADNKKMIRSESGALLPATYNSGRFKDWQQKRRRGTAITGDSRSGDKGGPASGILPAQAIHRHRKQQEQVSHVIQSLLIVSEKRRPLGTREGSDSERTCPEIIYTSLGVTMHLLCTKYMEPPNSSEVLTALRDHIVGSLLCQGLS